ncbi:MAG: prolipoprotein diacylglyceryl transferase [Candidatus Margulisbacteria bacterium]|nr:prolipoprotein diacylglyceryl transferase [Candidatus Margulisiibacteriota bacterium]
MYPILFKIGPFSIHAYGFMIAIAFLTGIIVALYYAKREGLKSETILDLALYVIIAAIVGARLLYVIGTWNQFEGNILEMFMVQRGGLIFLGGLILAVLVVIGYARIKKINVLKLLDILTPGTALGYAITRIGCFLNGCCFGLPTKLPWGLEFPFGSLAYSYYPHEHIHPTQLYSSGSMLAAFVILLILYQKKKYDGFVFYWGLLFYSIYRMLVEFLRFSPVHWLGLTPSQWVLVGTFILAISGLVYNYKQLRKD